MSRGFAKEEDQESVPLVTPRAHLPAGVTNYVTPEGLKDLKEEKQDLLNKQSSLIEESSEENRVQINHITATLNLLNNRINSARLINLSEQPQNEVHFGATVCLFDIQDNTYIFYQIVGVDQADIASNKISFLSPLAKALMNKRVDDIIELRTPKGLRKMKVKGITYE